MGTGRVRRAGILGFGPGEEAKMSDGPGKVVTPAETESFADWRDFHREGEASEFEYTDSTRAHIMEGESQHFRYGRDPLPEKM